jgi:hypothetical protein
MGWPPEIYLDWISAFAGMTEKAGLDRTRSHLKTSRAKIERGVRRRGTGVYTAVNEDSEPARNKAIPSAVVFEMASHAAAPLDNACVTPSTMQRESMGMPS